MTVLLLHISLFKNVGAEVVCRLHVFPVHLEVPLARDDKIVLRHHRARKLPADVMFFRYDQGTIPQNDYVLFLHVLSLLFVSALVL